MTYDELLQTINTQYPGLVPLLQQPGIFDVVSRAIEENWPANRLQAALEATPYFQSTPLSQRQFDVLKVTDPATARQKGDAVTNQLLHMAQALGITLTPQNQWDIVVSALNNNWGEAEMQHALLFGAAFTGLQVSGVGDVAGAAQNITELASQYGLPMGKEAATRWALGVKDGTVTSDALSAYMVEQAKSLYPGLAAALDSGMTVRQYADPYAQIAQKELGINSADYNLQDSKWSNPLNQIDPKTGERTAMTLDAWTAAVRSDPRYGYDTTNEAKDKASQFATQLAQQFGAMA